MKRTTAVLALGGALLAAPAAHAAPGTSLGVKADQFDVAMTSDGAAHVAYLTREGASDDFLVVCRIPAGGTACAQTTKQPLTADPDGPPIVLTDGTRVTALVADGDGATGRTEATTNPAATTGGSYGALKTIANVDAADVVLAPDGKRLWIVADHGPKSSPSYFEDYLYVTDAPLPDPGSTPSTGGAVLGSAPGGRATFNPQIAVRPDGRPLAILDATALPDRPAGQYQWAFNGDTSAPPTQIDDRSQWSDATSFAAPAPGEQNGGYRIASGNGAMWLGYQGLSQTVLLRKWTGSALGTPVNPDCTAKRDTLSEKPAVAIAPGGDVLLTTSTFRSGTDVLAFFRGNADGTAFSPFAEIASDTGVDDVQLAADPDQTRSVGAAVYTTDGIYGGDLKLVRLPATTFAGCPTAVTPVTTSPPVTMPPVTSPPTPVKRPALSSVVRGLPSNRACVSKRSFKIHLRNPKGTRIVRGTVKVNGKTKAVRKGKRVTSRIDLRGLPRGRYTVKITLKLADGRTLTYTRKYRTCTPGRKRRR